MKKQLLLLAVVFCCLNVPAQDFQWAKQIGGASFDQGRSIATDQFGNVYTAGTCNDNIDMNPGTGTFMLSTGAFIQKLDAAGNFVWAKKLAGGGTNGPPVNISLDAAGNIYATGTFTGTYDFDPGSGVYNLTSANPAPSIYVLKLDAAGNFVWAVQFKAANSTPAKYNSFSTAIKVDAAGNVFTTGVFAGTIDFDPSSNNFNILSNLGDRDIFVSKLDASGNFVWAKRLGSNDWELTNSLALDASGNAYITGYFQTTSDMDPDAGVYNLVSTGLQDAFICKLDGNSGSLVWAKAMGGSTGYDYGNGITVDASGNVFACGTFSGTADFNPSGGGLNIASNGGSDIFITKLDASGNLLWAKTIGGANSDGGYALTVDATGNLYITGGFAGTCDFDPGTNVFNLTTTTDASEFISASYGSAFILKLNTLGTFSWAVNMVGTGSSYPVIYGASSGYSIAIDLFGNVCTTGTFVNGVDFNPGAGAFSFYSSLGYSTNRSVDIFVSKLSQATLPIALLNFIVSKSNKDVLLTWQTASEINTEKFDLEKSDDGISFKKFAEVKAAGNSNDISSYQFTDFNAVSNTIKQTVYYRFKQMDLDGKFTYSPIRSIKFDEKSFALQVYPNPAKDFVTIQVSSIETNLPYTVVDKAGRKVLGGQIKNSNAVTLNIAQLPAGTYFVQVGNTKQTTKFIKQ